MSLKRRVKRPSFFFGNIILCIGLNVSFSYVVLPVTQSQDSPGYSPGLINTENTQGLCKQKDSRKEVFYYEF